MPQPITPPGHRQVTPVAKDDQDDLLTLAEIEGADLTQRTYGVVGAGEVGGRLVNDAPWGMAEIGRAHV